MSKHEQRRLRQILELYLHHLKTEVLYGPDQKQMLLVDLRADLQSVHERCVS